MLNMKYNDFKDVKIVFERIKGDNMNILVNILWKQDKEWKETENISVYAEIEGEGSRSFKLERLDNSNIWHTTMKIGYSLYEIANFDRKLAVKIVQYKVMPQKASYPYAS